MEALRGRAPAMALPQGKHVEIAIHLQCGSTDIEHAAGLAPVLGAMQLSPLSGTTARDRCAIAAAVLTGVAYYRVRVRTVVAARFAKSRSVSCRRATAKCNKSEIVAHAGSAPMQEASLMLLQASELRKEAAMLEADLVEQRLNASRRLFRRFVAKGSHGLDASGLQGALQEMVGSPVSMPHTLQLLQRYDSDQDGILKFDEFRCEQLLGELCNIIAVAEEEAVVAARSERKARWERTIRKRQSDRWEQLVASLPPPNRDASGAVRVYAAMPYAFVLLDGLRLFGPSFIALHLPSAYLAVKAVHDQVPWEFWDGVPFLHAILLLGMPTLAVQRRLPHLVRFNLNQAFVLDFFLIVSHALASTIRWLSGLAGDADAMYVPVLVEPVVLPGNEVIMITLAVCLVYSAACTLAGQIPSGIPLVSVEASRSLGTFGPLQKPRKQSSSQGGLGRGDGDDHDDTELARTSP